jgi:hypothetical protein
MRGLEGGAALRHARRPRRPGRRVCPTAEAPAGGHGPPASPGQAPGAAAARAGAGSSAAPLRVTGLAPKIMVQSQARARLSCQ